MQRAIRHASGSADERILVVCTKYVGDGVLAIPFLRNLRRGFPRARIDVLGGPGTRDILADCPHVDEVLVWSRPERRTCRTSLAASRTQAAWIRKRGYTRSYLLKRSLSAALMASWAGIPHRVGFASDWSWAFLSRSVFMRHGRHQVQLTLDLLRADGLVTDDGANENWTTPEAVRRVDSVLASLPAARRRVFLAVCSTDDQRHWPLDRWAQVTTWLVKERGCDVHLCSAPRDVAAHGVLRSLVDPGVAAHLHDLSHALCLREVPALLARMDACLGIDTGLLHVGASFGVPIVALFGPTDAARWAPWDTPARIVQQPGAAVPRRWFLRRRLRGGPSLAAVTADHVIASATALFDGLPDRGLRPARMPASVRWIERPIAVAAT